MLHWFEKHQGFGLESITLTVTVVTALQPIADIATKLALPIKENFEHKNDHQRINLFGDPAETLRVRNIKLLVGWRNLQSHSKIFFINFIIGIASACMHAFLLKKNGKKIYRFLENPKILTPESRPEKLCSILSRPLLKRF